MLQPALVDLREPKKLTPITIESGGVTITQDDDDPIAAWVEVNGESIKLNYHDLDMLARRFSMS